MSTRLLSPSALRDYEVSGPAAPTQDFSWASYDVPILQQVWDLYVRLSQLLPSSWRAVKKHSKPLRLTRDVAADELGSHCES